MEKRKIAKIIIHCSDTDFYLFPDHDDISWIDLVHRAKGWKMVGYHFFIRGNIDHIQEGRKLDQVGSHCYGENSDSIGICLSGRKRFEDHQFKNLFNLVSMLQVKYKIDTDKVYGHYEFNGGKTCPNFNMDKFRECLSLNQVPTKKDLI